MAVSAAQTVWTLSLGHGSGGKGCSGVEEPHTDTRLPLATITVCVVTSKPLTGLGLERELNPGNLEPRGPEVAVHNDLASLWVARARWTEQSLTFWI